MMPRWSAATIALAMIASGVASFAADAPASAASPVASQAPTLAPHDLSAQDADVFFDGLVPYAIARGDIAGGVLVIVKDGKVLFSKGYGYANVAKREPVIVDKTLFRIGSVSKTFTWTAVMQQVQAGKLDLDRDVNDYLDFRIPEKFGKPITLRNLMTHTPGFEEGINEAFVQKASQLYPLGDYLKKHIPARIYPPGKVVSYSNYGASLAGYIVQRVSGEPFADYIANHIFKPLDMQHASFVQPLPTNLAPDMAEGYLQASDKKPFPFEFVETAPAGSMSATGADMAHFMIAHLENGRYDGAAILSPSTVALMHSPQSHMAPGVNGFDLGFYQENRNGLRIIGHAGDTSAFHSDLHLLLDKDIGVFMSFNSLGKEGESDRFRTTLFRAFLDRYFPYAAPEEKTLAHPQADAARVAGWYSASRRIVSGLRLISAFGQSQIVADADGTITIDVLKDVGGNLKHWREVAPLVYREVGGQTHTKFVTDRNGHIRYWISDDFLPVELFLREGGLTQQGVAIYLLGGLVVVLSLSLIFWVGGWFVRRRFGRTLELTASAARLRLVARLGAIAILAMFAGWALLFSEIGKGIWTLDRPLAALYVLGVVAFLGALAILAEAALRFLRGPGGLFVRAGELVFGLSALCAIWAIFEYGLANFSFTY